MPRVTVRTPQPQDYLYDRSFEAYGRAGQALQSGLEHAQSLRAAERRARVADQQHAQQMQIAEQRAQASLLKEANALSEKQAKAAEHEGDRDAVLATLQEEGTKARGQAQQEQIDRALASPNGMLGPFGMATAMAKGAPNTMQTQARWDGYKELAKRMDPRFASTWLHGTLTRDAAEEKQRIIKEGYAQETKHLDAAIKEGWFEDPFGPAAKGGELSPETQKVAEDLAKKIQTDLALGKPPGVVSHTLSLAHAKHSMLATRKRGWEKADIRAEGIFDSLREMTAGIPSGVNPITGADLSAEFADRLAVAEGQWSKTRGEPGVSESYRREHDPDAALGTLKEILFRAQAKADPQGFATQPPPLNLSQGNVVKAATAQQSQTHAPGQAGLAPSQAAQEAPGAGQAPQARKGAKRTPAAGQEEQVAAVVQEELGRLQAAPKTQRRAAIKGLLDRLEHDFGIDMNDPKVAMAVKNAISQATGR